MGLYLCGVAVWSTFLLAEDFPFDQVSMRAERPLLSLQSILSQATGRVYVTPGGVPAVGSV